MDSFTAAGDGANTKPFYPVLIIGAGPSGIAMGCRLSEKMGFQDFKIFERQSGIGGMTGILGFFEGIDAV